MDKTRLIISLAILLIFSTSSYSQYYSSGQDPFSVRWKQIKTRNFHIIYPDNFEEKAQYLANLMELVYPRISYSLDEYPKRMPLIMHEHSARSNAFVGWAPKRMEFYSVPPQDSYAQPWLDQLALHEQRHTVQMNKMYKGTGKVLSWLLGQQGPIAVLGLYVPFWFLEGDATVVETALSRSGRGRMPHFENTMRAQVLERGLYSYDKAMFRSYRDYVPDQYVFGYHFVAQARKKYGAGLWDYTLDMVANKAYMIVPFNYGIKKYTGLSKTELYIETFNALKGEWKRQKALSRTTYYREITTESKYFTNYSNPEYAGAGDIIARKSGMDDITRFIKITDQGEERTVYTPGSSNANALAVSNGKIYWSEYEPDPRWSNRSYSVIREYDRNTGKRRKLSRKSRYFVPDLSPDGSKLALVDVDGHDRYSLKILDTEDGTVLKSISTPDNTFFMTPRWSEDNRNIAVILLNRDGKGLALIDSETAEINLIIPFGFTEISKPYPLKDRIYFTGAYNGIDNIYALNIKDGSIQQLTSSVFGATNACPSPDGKMLLYSDYSSKGYRLVEMPLDSALWLPLENVEDHSARLYENISKQEDWVLDDVAVPDSSFQSKRFRRLGHLFNIHSWAPVSIDISSYEIEPGVMFLSQNKLSTSLLMAGYGYNVREETGRFYVNYSYEGLYPVFDFNLDYGNRRGRLKQEDGSVYDYEWWETNFTPRISVPLNFTRGKYLKGFTPYVFLDQKFISRVKPDPDIFRTKQITAMGYRLFAYHQLRTSIRDIYPRWGQVLDISYSNEPFSGDGSSIFALNTYFYLPGLIRHHGLRLYAAYQQREIDNYKFSDRITYSRGYSQMQDQEAISLSATYKFPLWCPDLSIPPIIYLKRIKMALFYDYAIGRNGGADNYYRSAGIDLSGDMHLLRFLAPFDLGVRFIYLTETNTLATQFLIGVSFDSFYLGQDRDKPGKIY